MAETLISGVASDSPGGITPQAQDGGHQGCKGGDPIARLNHDGPALHYLRALSQQVLTLFTGKRCNVKNSPFLGPGAALTGHLALQSCSLSPNSSPASLVFTSPHLQGLQAVGSTLHSQPLPWQCFLGLSFFPLLLPALFQQRSPQAPQCPDSAEQGCISLPLEESSVVLTGTEGFLPSAGGGGGGSFPHLL